MKKEKCHILLESQGRQDRQDQTKPKEQFS
jgi:hypothetical protein